MKKSDSNIKYHVVQAFADSDNLSSLLRFYMPIAGANAIALYLLLKQEVGKTRLHDYLYQTLDINVDEFDKARYSIEALGLIKSYLKKEKNNSYFIYQIFSPLSANQFIDNIIFQKLLSTKPILFNDYIKPLITDPVIGGQVEEVSASFMKIYGLKSTIYSEEKLIKRSEDKYDIELVKSLSPAIELKAFNKKTCQAIEQIGSLTKISVKEMVKLLYSSYDAKKKIISITKLQNAVSKKIKTVVSVSDEKNDHLVKTLTPLEYLKYRNKVEIEADKRTVIDIVSTSGLKNEVINVAVDYVLFSKDDYLCPYTLSRVIGRLARKKITSAESANALLFKISSSNVSDNNDNKVDELLAIIKGEQNGKTE